ncbi:MAG: PaaI family thioesterase [Bacillota bacterium]
MRFPRQIPFIEMLGVELLEQEPGRVVTGLSLRPELENSWQVAHGGVTMAMMDVTAGMALLSVVGAEHGVATVSLTCHFISPGRGRLVCEGRLVHRGARLATCEAEVRDQEGGLVARAIGTFAVRRGRGHSRSRSRSQSSETPRASSWGAPSP